MSDELFDWVAIPHPDEDCKVIALAERKQTGCGPDGDFASGFCTLWSSGTPHSAEELAQLFIAAPAGLTANRLTVGALQTEYMILHDASDDWIYDTLGPALSAAYFAARAAIAKATTP